MKQVVKAAALLVLLVASTGVRPVPTEIEELRWLAGHWEGMEGETRMEEVWMEPLGGVMIGMHRDVFGSDRFFFESLMIRETDDGIVFFASPAGRHPATPFPLTDLSGTKAVFSNPEHDFPQTLTYELTSAGDLHVVAAGEQNGRKVRSAWTWAKR
jgi:hypothetical protein